MSVKRLPLFALALMPLASGAWVANARAADATPDGAKTLESQVRSWVVDLLGPTVKLPSRPVQITPDGDHYAVAVPFGDAADAARMTATARAGDDGRWTIDSIRMPSPLEFKINLPQPGGKDATDGKPAMTMTPVNYTVTFGQQSSQLLFDPSYRTPSTLNGGFQNMDVVATGEALHQTSHVDRSATTTVLRPAGDGRVDMISDGTLEGYRIMSTTADTGEVQVSMGRVKVNSTSTNVSRDRAVEVLHALIKIGGAMQGAAGTAANVAAPPLSPAEAQALLQALADFASSLSIDETFEQLAVSYGGLGGSLNTAQLGLAAKSENGLLNARMDIGAAGLTLPELGLGDMVQLIPSKIALRPTVSGVAVADLLQLAKASDNGGSPSPADFEALFSHGGIVAGLESFSIDVAGAGFTGMGKLVFTSPEAFSGTAQITATNLDQLQQRVAQNPQLAQVLPVFIVAKGIGRTVDNRMVWDVSYQNGRLLVNNQDLSAMTGAAPPPPAAQELPKAPAARPQAQPRPNQRRQ